MDYISFSIILFVVVFIVFVCGVVDLNKNYNTQKTDIFNKNFELIKSDEIYAKLKYIQPQQISLSGVIDLKMLTDTVNKLRNQYKSLTDKDENNSLTEKIRSISRDNEDLAAEITALNKSLIEKNKELDDLLRSNNTKREEFESILFIYTLKNIL